MKKGMRCIPFLLRPDDGIVLPFDIPFHPAGTQAGGAHIDLLSFAFDDNSYSL